MCGRFSLEIDDTFYPRYEIENIIEIRPMYNVSPSMYIPVVLKNSPKKVIEMKWGFLPPWSKDVTSKYAMINSRAESIDSKVYFKEAFKKNRCLIPATGFYEWKKEPTEKRPYYIHLRDNSYFSFAGIYSIVKDMEGKEVYTCSIITTEPNTLVSDIHDRMPVILSKEEEEVWLDKEVEEDILKSLLDPYPSEEMEAFEVSTRVNSPKNNDRELITPV
jgi:putative SOS response-associated peptidase YedK